jgi:hypothetical protein
MPFDQNTAIFGPNQQSHSMESPKNKVTHFQFSLLLSKTKIINIIFAPLAARAVLLN